LDKIPPPKKKLFHGCAVTERKEEGKAERCKVDDRKKNFFKRNNRLLHLQIIRFFQWRTINENGEHK